MLVAAISTENEAELVRRLHQELPQLRLLVICLGSPRLLGSLGDSAAVLIQAYSDTPASQRRAAKMLAAHVPPP